MKTLQHKFVEFVPEMLESDTIYISLTYCTAIHLCMCGCGNEVVTPISPVDWQIKFDGKSVSLTPSIGNWNFECQSHYWIVKNRIEYSQKWTNREIQLGRKLDEKQKADFYLKEKDIDKALNSNDDYKPQEKVPFWKLFLQFIGFK